MQYMKFILPFFILALLSCSDSNDTTSSAIVNAKYTCPELHENAEKDGAGVCRVCNKNLVKKVNIKGIELIDDFSENSVYQHNATWTSQNDDVIKLHGYKGGLVLTTMIFTNCEYACPTIMGDLQNIEDGLKETTKENLNVVIVTMDPDTDTPKVLKEYANQFDVNENRWSLLTGSKDDIYLFSKLLDLGYKRFENGMYGHANIISLLNKNGEIVYQQEGLKKNNDEFIRLIEEMSISK